MFSPIFWPPSKRTKKRKKGDKTINGYQISIFCGFDLLVWVYFSYFFFWGFASAFPLLSRRQAVTVFLLGETQRAFCLSWLVCTFARDSCPWRSARVSVCAAAFTGISPMAVSAKPQPPNRTATQKPPKHTAPPPPPPPLIRQTIASEFCPTNEFQRLWETLKPPKSLSLYYVSWLGFDRLYLSSSLAIKMIGHLWLVAGEGKGNSLPHNYRRWPPLEASKTGSYKWEFSLSI